MHYDPETGIFRWKIRLSKATRVGDIAGRYTNNGYIVIGIGGREYTAHGLAWLYIHGEYVPLDHKDRIIGNNAIANLRPASNSQNQANRCAPINNSTGFKGVQFRSGKYEAYIIVRWRRLYLGRFYTIEEAASAYNKAAIEHFGEFAYV